MGDFIAYELLPIILNMSLTASAVIALVLLARLALRRAPRICSYALWLVVLFRLLCPVSVTADVSLMGLLDTPVTGVTDHTSAAAYVPRDVVHNPAPTVDLPIPGASEAITDALPQGEEQMVADPLEAPMAIATLVWLTGVTVMAVWGVVSLLRLRRRLVGAVPLEKGVYLADHIGTPFVLGLARPKIYLPSSLPEREQGYILLHERHHIRRLDHVVKLLAFLALCIHWFNPLAWLFFVLLGKDMEMSCDEAAMKKLGEAVRADYSASLLSLATGRRIIAGAPLAFGEGDTRDRVKNVLQWREPKLWLVVLSVAAVVVLAVVCGTNAVSKSTVKTRAVEDGVEVTMTLRNPVRSYAIYEEIYQDGRLISGKPIITNSSGEYNWDQMPRKSTFALRAESSLLSSGGFSGEVTTRYEENGATAERTDQLPGTRYTGMGNVLGTGSQEGTLSRETHLLDAGDSAVLCSILFSEEPDGKLCVYHNGWSLAKVNDTVIQYRLVISPETKEVYQDLPLDLAQTLYDLRVETLNDREDRGAQTAVRTLLDTMGASDCGSYELQYYDLSKESQFSTAKLAGAYWPGGTGSAPPYAKTGLVIWYDAVSDEAAFWAAQKGVPDLLLALVPELSEVYIGCAGPDGTAGYVGSSDQDDAYLREYLGYESFEEAGSSAAGVRALMKLLEWPESGAESTGSVGESGKPRLTLEDVRELAKKGEALSWADFESYDSTETGSGLYIRVYPIDETFSVWIGSGGQEEEPLYINLSTENDRIDLRREDVDAFIRSHLPPGGTENSAAISLTEGTPFSPVKAGLDADGNVSEVTTADLAETLASQTLPDGTEVLFYRSVSGEKYCAYIPAGTERLLRFTHEDNAYTDGYSISLYEDVLGHSGFRIACPRGAAYYANDYYYFDDAGTLWMLVDCSGGVFMTDLDGDGQKELLWSYHGGEFYYETQIDGQLYTADICALTAEALGYQWSDGLQIALEIPESAAASSDCIMDYALTLPGEDGALGKRLTGTIRLTADTLEVFPGEGG